MAYVTIPKDLSQVKTKFLFNLTKRQVICFGCGILAGLPLFFILRGVIPASAAALIMIVVMMPFFLFAMYERNGEPLEKVLRHIYDAKFKRPKQRPYKTNNFYTVLTRQAKLDKEVRAIVQGR
ncbi:MAG: PrgI family protein [Clostridia bacterium]|nr:PrgI family protein [Clostridia bacterium]